MDLMITLTNREEWALNKMAQSVGLPPEEYGHNIIVNFLKGQIRGYYQNIFNNKTEAELVDIFGVPE